MKLKFILLIILIVNCFICHGQIGQVVIPQFEDEYCVTISKLEAGETEIDFLKFRESFVESQQYKIAKENSQEFRDLREKMYKQMEDSEFQQIIETTKQMLSIDYTSMTAHKILRQTYEIIEDDLNAKKYKSIQFGLLNSIVRNGDGKTCQTAWPVIQISEQYFILEMLNAKFKSQTIDNKNGICDEMKVEMNGKEEIYFFDTSRIFEQYVKR